MTRSTVFAAVFLACFARSASATERITDFSSEIRVSQTGALTVTETISVDAEGEAIRHGIFRDFPTIYTKNGRRIRVGFDVLSVALDGHDEPYSVAAIENGERVKIGDPNALIAPGPHRFTLSYATDRQIAFLNDHDELYWNVTGNFWRFPIDHSEALIELPAGAGILRSSAYTGPVGSTAQSAQSETVSSSSIRFDTTAPLGPQEGLTVAVAFSKGAVLPPSPEELRQEFFRDNAAAIVASAGVLLMLVYFAIVWLEHGRRPPRGTVIPLFAPPKDFSPAAVRFVYRMTYDRKAYAASLVDMAVKGYLKIAESGSKYVLTRTGKTEQDTNLAACEAALARKLFAYDDTVELKQDNHVEIARSISALQHSLTAEYERVYFVTNSIWFGGGVAMLIVTAIASAVLCDNPQAAAGALVGMGALALGATALVHKAGTAWSGAFSGAGSRALNALRATFLTGSALPFVAGWAIGFYALARRVPLTAVLPLSIGAALAYAFYHLLKHPTLLGASIVDEIEGFKLFLTVAEKDRLEALNPPNVTPEVFEKFLPYAIALDCENQWSSKFEAEAAAAGVTPGSGSCYSPVWYSGSSLDRVGSAGFAESLGASMAASAASAAVAPGSGSGGGGFSGGGGGGGGGGGW